MLIHSGVKNKKHRQIHTVNEILLCHMCDKSFKKASELKQHMPIHFENRPFVCNECNQSFKQSNGLRNHRIYSHNREKPFTCNICEKSFKLAFLVTIVQNHFHKRMPSEFISLFILEKSLILVRKVINHFHKLQVYTHIKVFTQWKRNTHASNV